MATQIYLTDGSMDFSMGVDSGKVPLVQSPSNPNGLRRDQLAWLENATVRGGGITQRAGWKFLTEIADGSQLYQGGWMYEPREQDPFFVFSIGGHILRMDALSGSVPLDLSAATGLFNPPDVERAYFAQAEEFLIIQAGDYGQGGPVIPGTTDANGNTLPLFYDSHLMRRSNGITGVVIPGPTVNEIPAATHMDYYMQRLWYAQSRRTSAGDIVGGPAGTPSYEKRDSVLKVTENPLALAGDGFAVPTHAGAIRALTHSGAIDTVLGQGQLYIFTRKVIYSLNVPVTRKDWIAADDSNQPLQKVIQKKFGTGADRSVVAINGDLFYQTMEPGIRTLALAVRYFQQWGNTPISRNINRVLAFNDRSLLRFGSGILFDNRLWETALPFSSPVGPIHKAMAILDFDIISSFQDKLSGADKVPAWEGISSGLNVLQLFTGDFGGLERAFAVVQSAVTGTIQLWELTAGDRFENGDNRVEWTIEFPSFQFGDETKLKELQSMAVWVDREYGTVDYTMYYRPEFDPCWHFWYKWQRCIARTSCEDVNNPVCYPVSEGREGYEIPMTLPHPPKDCDTLGNRPSFQGRFFQTKLVIKGFCRVRGIELYATKIEEALYNRKVC